jgi:hypothetical protein
MMTRCQWLQTRPVEVWATVPRRPGLFITTSVRSAQRHEGGLAGGYGRLDISRCPWMGINGVFAFCILHGNIHDSRNQRAYQTPRRIGSVNCFGGSYKAGPAMWTGG